MLGSETRCFHVSESVDESGQPLKGGGLSSLNPCGVRGTSELQSLTRGTICFRVEDAMGEFNGKWVWFGFLNTSFICVNVSAHVLQHTCRGQKLQVKPSPTTWGSRSQTARLSDSVGAGGRRIQGYLACMSLGPEYWPSSLCSKCS